MKGVQRSTIRDAGTPERECAVELGEAILKLTTGAKDLPEPKKNSNLQIEGLRFRFLNSKGKGKIIQKANLLQTGKTAHLQKDEYQAGCTLI